MLTAESETADELAELTDQVEDDKLTSPAEAGMRAFGHSKDHRGDVWVADRGFASAADRGPTSPAAAGTRATFRGRPGRVIAPIVRRPLSLAERSAGRPAANRYRVDPFGSGTRKVRLTWRFSRLSEL